VSTDIERIVNAAVAAGVLPAGATAPVQDARPWPVVLLTALGAWLAALPLLGVLGLMLGGLLRQGGGLYVVGLIVLLGAVLVLRTRTAPLFVEQLAVPALLVGGGSLGYCLYRDLPRSGASVAMAALALAVGWALPRAWLRVLLGATAAAFTMLACVPHVDALFGRFTVAPVWLAWHGCLGLLLVAGVLQRRVFDDGAGAPKAAALESLGAGWLLATLAGLAWWSGLTMLVGGSAGGGLVGSMAHDMARMPASPWRSAVLPAGSVLLALAAVGWAARAWPVLRQPWCAGLALVLAALAWFMPALGAVLLALALCATSGRWRLACAAALAAAWIVGAFYYQLHWPLATKAAVLVAAAVVQGGLAWWARRAVAAVDSPPHPTIGRDPRLLAGVGLSMAAVLAVANVGIWQKESLIARGQPVYVELAPVDPRSLMQGDFMQLNYRMPASVTRELGGLLDGDRPRVVARRDERGVATVVRLDTGAPLAGDELRIELTPKDGRWVLVSDAWFFKEGEAARWAPAKYGEFRVAPDGQALLVGLKGAALNAL
jgi:uncharacterized membrane-anchored protein